MVDQGITLTGMIPITEFESARVSLEAMGEAEVTGVEYEVQWVVSQVANTL